MTIVLTVLFIVAVLFGFVILFGAPYLPTRRAQQIAALDLLDLKPGQIFYDLGCGDGRLLRVAAERGLKVVGYELNPILAVIARLRTIRYRKNVRVVCSNFWRADVSNADGIFVFLITRFMPRLDKFVARNCTTKNIKVVSFAFMIPGKKPAGKRGGVILYVYRPLARRH